MPKSQNLRSRLKTADRRRRRRLADKTGSNETSEVYGGQDHPASRVTAPQSQVPDVAGVLTEAALHSADRHGKIRDTAIIGALRAIVNTKPPKSPEAALVYESMLARLDQAGIGAGERRKGAAELLKVSMANVDPKVHDQLIKFLTLITS